MPTEAWQGVYLLRVILFYSPIGLVILCYPIIDYVIPDWSTLNHLYDCFSCSTRILSCRTVITLLAGLSHVTNVGGGKQSQMKNNASASSC